METEDDDEINLNEHLQVCGNPGEKNNFAHGKKFSPVELESPSRDESKSRKSAGEISANMPEKNSESALKKQSGEDEIINVSPRKSEVAQIGIQSVLPKTEPSECTPKNRAQEKLAYEPDKTGNAAKETLRTAQADDVEIIPKNRNARAKSNLTLDKSDKPDEKNPISQNQNCIYLWQPQG